MRQKESRTLTVRDEILNVTAALVWKTGANVEERRFRAA